MFHLSDKEIIDLINGRLLLINSKSLEEVDFDITNITRKIIKIMNDNKFSYRDCYVDLFTDNVIEPNIFLSKWFLIVARKDCELLFNLLYEDEYSTNVLALVGLTYFIILDHSKMRSNFKESIITRVIGFYYYSRKSSYVAFCLSRILCYSCNYETSLDLLDEIINSNSSSKTFNINYYCFLSKIYLKRKISKRGDLSENYKITQ